MNIESVQISRADFDAYLQQTVRYVTGCLADKPESLMPHLMIHAIEPENGEKTLSVCALAVDFNEDTDKHTILFGIGREFYKRQEIPVAVFLSSEAWLVRDPPPGTEPRHCANKQEVVIICGMSMDKKHQDIANIPVTRDAQGLMIASAEGEKVFEKRNVQVPLLAHFYRGFFDHVVTKYGMKP